MMFKKNLGKRLFLCIILTVLSFSVNAQPVYQLGDIEPAGEIIFLGAMNKNVFGTSLDIGNSRGNTQLTELNINGFPNWFLPSTDELYSTYANLGQNNFGNKILIFEPKSLTTFIRFYII